MKCIFCKQDAGEALREYRCGWRYVTEYDVKAFVVAYPYRFRVPFAQRPAPGTRIDVCVYCVYVNRYFGWDINLGTRTFRKRSREHRLLDAMKGLAR